MEPSRVPVAAGPGVIEVLADEVINQIAAGEVVERPASVVKELVDNALDAGARTITVECDGGGRARIRVTDDGGGMSAADARRCFQRHATSKIRGLDDLEGLATMGFRGEALASIASVSRTSLTTRRPGDLAATRVVVAQGALEDVSEVGAAVGTTVEVSELFANVPVRLKFLKAEATEASHVTEAVSRLAMAHPAVAFRLRHGGRSVLELPPDRDGLARALALFGSRLGQRLHRVVGHEQGFTVEAYLAAPELAQTTARGVQLFVGRRAVRDRGLLHAVCMGYGELVPRGRYPVAIVLVDAPVGQVDFNVHPQKSEVRFADAGSAAAAVRHAVRAGVASAPWLGESAGAATLQMSVRTSAPLAAEAAEAPATPLAHRYAAHLAHLARPAPQLRFDRPEPPRQASHAAEGPARWDAAVRAARQVGAPVAPAAPERGLAAALAEVAREAVSEAVSEAGRQAVEADDESEREDEREAAARPPVRGSDEDRGREQAFAVADAGARQGGRAHERGPAPGIADGDGSVKAGRGYFSSLRYLGQLQLTYLVCEADGELVLIDQHAAHERVEYQKLLERRHRREGVPTQRLLFPSTIEVSPAHAAVVDEVAALGAQIGYEIELFGRSAIAIKAVPADLRRADPVAVLRELLDDWVDHGGSRAVDSRLENLLATIACHCAVRAGDRLAPGEVEALLQSLDAVDFRAHCPHGRPALLRLSLDEIARRFGR